jgi:single-strand DNA-binding protein
MIEGNLTQDPELIEGHTSLCKMVISSKRCWKNKYGKNEEEVFFIDVIYRDRLAEDCAKYLKKGSRILVSGYLAKGMKGKYLLGKEANFISSKK